MAIDKIIYGENSPEQSEQTLVSFAYGSIIAAASNTTPGSINFGYDEEHKAGAIFRMGKLVTSKVIDIILSDKETEGVHKVTVKFIDTDGVIRTKEFETVDKSLINTLLNNTIDDVEKSFEDKINKKVDTSLYNNKISQLDSSIAEIKSATDKVATYDILGMIKVGNDFDISEDGLLTLYQKPSVITFNNNCDNKGANSSNIFEKGTVVNKVVLTWLLNKTAKTVTVDNDDVTGTNSKTYDNLSLSNNKTYTLKFTDVRNASASATTSIYFRNKIYLGTSSMTENFDSDFIISLSNKTFATSNSAFGTKTISAGDTEYIYYAAPSSFGTPSWTDGAGIYTFDKMKSFDFTNESGYVENYTVWRASDAPGLKNQKITIS